MDFSKDIYAYVKSGETQEEKLGLEIEHFVVDENGMQMQFAEISSLIAQVGKMLEADVVYVDGYPVGYSTIQYAVSLEPSCQFEISISPYSKLSEIAEVYQAFLSVWKPLFRERGYRIVTKGNLPLVECGFLEPEQIPLSPKKRYQYMDTYLGKSGKYGKHMMRAAASTQVSIDYRSESDLIRKLRVLQKISPILMIMMENKSVEKTTLPGVSDKPHLFRIQEWDDLDPARTGFFPNSMDADFGYEKIADVVCRTPLILLTDDGQTIDVGHKNANELVAEHIIAEDALTEARRKRLTEHFLSMGFFHFRIKKYIEIRVADSVPICKALGYTALLKGIVYSQRNLDHLENELTDIDTLEKIQIAVDAIERNGHHAVIYHNKTALDWALHLVALAKEGLSEREKEYLIHV